MSRIYTWAQCTSCWEIVRSKSRHDYRECSCGDVAIDGGLDYVKMSVDPNGGYRTLPASLGDKFFSSDVTFNDDWERLCAKEGFKNTNGAVGRGWWHIMSRLLMRLRLVEVPEDGIAQIKEKFGGLRVYLEEPNSAAYKYIEDAEGLCAKTCEVCGEPGEAREGGWIKTLCDIHA